MSFDRKIKMKVAFVTILSMCVMLGLALADGYGSYGYGGYGGGYLARGHGGSGGGQGGCKFTFNP